MTGWSNATLAPFASSNVSSLAYVYPDAGGRLPGIAAGPRSPTVYSVTRNVPCASADPTPLEDAAVALTPGGNSTVAVRAPLLSFDSSPRAVCQAVPPNTMAVVFADAGMSANGGTTS